jgi:predicted nucleic acid-binding protein
MGVIVSPEPLAITCEAMDRARQLLDEHSRLMARDALDVAVVEVCGLDSICSLERDFDVIRGLRRIEP